MAFENFLDLIPVKKEQIHIIPTDMEPADAATAYQQVLQKYFASNRHTFDFVLLGLGDNAHTLSLFPGYDVVHEKKEWVSAFYLKEQNMYRITITAPVINKAAVVAFLVSGADKAMAVKQILKGKKMQVFILPR
jgi:6-phosphogluconolactonase